MMFFKCFSGTTDSNVQCLISKVDTFEHILTSFPKKESLWNNLIYTYIQCSFKFKKHNFVEVAFQNHIFIILYVKQSSFHCIHFKYYTTKPHIFRVYCII